MTKALILQPVNPNYPDEMKELASSLLSRLPKIDNGIELQIEQDDIALDIPPHKSMYAKHAAVRNYMIDTYLKPEHDFVVWIDADLMAYPIDICSKLIQANPRGLAAPLVVMEHHRDKFFDIAGFIEHNGMRSDNNEPWFKTPIIDGVIDLDSVGTLYSVPASLYKEGARYSPPYIDYYVEHWSLCREARLRGLKVVAVPSITIVHTWLPDYGLEIH